MISISSLVDMCVAKGYITQDQAPWLYYGIEKRLTTILISIPTLILLLIALYIMQLSQFSTGILLDIVMTAVMLVLAYILTKGGK